MQTPSSDETSVCLSVRPSVSLSVKRVHCDKTEERSVQIFSERELNLRVISPNSEDFGADYAIAVEDTPNYRSKAICRANSHEPVRYVDLQAWSLDLAPPGVARAPPLTDRQTDRQTVWRVMDRQNSHRYSVARVCNLHSSGVCGDRVGIPKPEIPNRYPLFSNTDTDTDVGILNTEIPTSEYRKYRIFGSVFSAGAVSCVFRCVIFETGQLNQPYWYLVMTCSPPELRVYSLVILTSIWTV